MKLVECPLCKFVVNYVDNIIQNNKSEAAIEAALEKVCTILPKSIEPACKTFVDTYGPILVQLLAKYGTAEQVCDALKLCNNGTQSKLPRKYTYLDHELVPELFLSIRSSKNSKACSKIG